MLFMSGICFVLAILTLTTKALPPKRRRIIAFIEIAAMILLLSDRYAYIYRGDPSNLGYWMVRICNFLVYLMTLYISHALTLYLIELFRSEGRLEIVPKRLWAAEFFFAAGLILLIISQFTGLYYTFDATNTYQRAPANILCYVAPFIITFLQISVVFQFRRLLRPMIFISIGLNTLVPLIASVIQIFTYGLSLTNMTVVGMAIFLYIFVLLDLNETVEHAKNMEIEFYRQEKENEHDMFEQTAEALASAIDAKDRYTHGHSSRVAQYSRMIAKDAGKSDEECEKIYFAALLHDVGKIGIPDTIINKDGKLTDEEFDKIKLHPLFGSQILSRIHKSPDLQIGARSHHERYDGKGYPDGLKGEEIPEIARIIGVADAYDAMTSKRSYRDPLPQERVRAEIAGGTGTQFDPKFAEIMLRRIDMDSEYTMKENSAPSERVFLTPDNGQDN